MLPLKLMTALVSGDIKLTNNPLFLTQNYNHHLDEDENPIQKPEKRTPLMLFVPTQELVRDTYRLSQIARATGMDINPNPSLSHIIFSWPSSSPKPLSLGAEAVPIPFPSFKTATLTHLRLFVNLSKGYFRLAFLSGADFDDPVGKIGSLSNNNWHCTSLALFFARTGEKIVSMDGFSKVLLGMGWSLFMNNVNDYRGKSSKRVNVVYLYRKLGVNKICDSGSGQCSRVKELKLPLLDFGNVPLRILQYVLLMTDDIFYLA